MAAGRFSKSDEGGPRHNLCDGRHLSGRRSSCRGHRPTPFGYPEQGARAVGGGASFVPVLPKGRIRGVPLGLGLHAQDEARGAIFDGLVGPVCALFVGGWAGWTGAVWPFPSWAIQPGLQNPGAVRTKMQARRRAALAAPGIAAQGGGAKARPPSRCGSWTL